jgi:hypothetical protein
LLKSNPANAEAKGLTATFAKGVPEILNPKANATQKSNKTEYKTMKGKKTAKANAQAQQNCSTCQRQKSEHCTKCHGFNNYKPNFTTMESYQ